MNDATVNIRQTADGRWYLDEHDVVEQAFRTLAAAERWAWESCYDFAVVNGVTIKLRNIFEAE